MQTKNEYILGKTAALFGHEIVILYSSSELYFSGNSDTLCGNSLRIVYFFWMYGGQGRGRKGGRGKEGGEGREGRRRRGERKETKELANVECVGGGWGGGRWHDNLWENY